MLNGANLPSQLLQLNQMIFLILLFGQLSFLTVKGLTCAQMMNGQDAAWGEFMQSRHEDY